MTRQEAIGNWMLKQKAIYGKDSPGPLSWFANRIDWKDFPNNRKDESLGTQTAEKYKEELRNNPDKHAQEMLRAIERGEKLEEDPSGT